MKSSYPFFKKNFKSLSWLYFRYEIVLCSGHKDSVSSVSFSADGQLLASGGFEGIIHVWDVSAEKLKCTLDGPGAGIEVLVLRMHEITYTRLIYNIDDEM